MSTRKLIARRSSLALAFAAGAALAETPGLGKPISEADIKAWDIAVLPDGTDLPPGSGTPAQGAKIYAEKCAAVPRRGRQGRPRPGYGPMVGGAPLTSGIDTPKTIDNFSGHADDRLRLRAARDAVQRSRAR